MNLRLPGWRKRKLNKDKLREAVEQAESQPAIKSTAICMLSGMSFDDKDWEKATEIWYKMKARRLMERIILENPGGYGLVRIDPTEITGGMSSKELAAFCEVPVNHVYDLANGAPGNGLPKPEWPLGRTLQGRGWRFPVETARLYAERLVGSHDSENY